MFGTNCLASASLEGLKGTEGIEQCVTVPRRYFLHWRNTATAGLVTLSLDPDAPREASLWPTSQELLCVKKPHAFITQTQRTAGPVPRSECVGRFGSSPQRAGL